MTLPDARWLTLSRHATYPILVLGAAAACLASGCSKPAVSVYSVPNEVAEGTREGWNAFTPEGWALEEPQSEFGGSLSHPGRGVEMSFMRFNDMSGQEVDTVNIVRAAVGLGEIPEQGLDQLSEIVPIGPTFGRLFSMESEAPVPGATERARILVSLLNRKGVTWFFKLNGPVEEVRASEPAFRDFLAKGAFVPATAPAAPAGGGGTTTTAAPEVSLPDWSLPEGWSAAQSSGPMVLATFQAPGDVVVTVTRFGMDPRSPQMVAMNVNRWRGQLGLTPFGEGEEAAAVTPIEVSGRTVRVVDLTTEPSETGEGILALWDFDGESSWFYKAQGPAAAAQALRDDLMGLAEGVTYGGH